MTAPDAYWEEARAAFHHCAAEDARVRAGPEPGPQPAVEASDPGRYEPAPYDLGICDDPEVTWPAEPAREALERQIAESGPEAGLGHDYDGPELRSGTPEYAALYAEYQAWVAQPEPEAEP
jgi:hypothetical protein